VQVAGVRLNTAAHVVPAGQRPITVDIAGTTHTAPPAAAPTPAAHEPGPRRPPGPVLIAFNGSAAAEQAPVVAARLLAQRRVLVLVVWKAGLGFELLDRPAVPGLPPAPIDIRTAVDIDESMYQSAQRLARRGATIAREAGLEAEALVVAEDPDISIAETIVRVARERDSPAVFVGERAHSRLGEVFLGAVSRDVIRYAPCPAIVVRHPLSFPLTARPGVGRTAS
jgi:nucleotide-binding universal stress UspA family protein